jgi:hypothetical protein
MISKHTMLYKKLPNRKLPHRKLSHRKLPVAEDEPPYALYYLRSPMKQKEKRRNSKHRKRSGSTHLRISSIASTIH